MKGNLESKVNYPAGLVQGPLVGENLLDAFKHELITESVLQLMFGSDGCRIFTKDRPSLNESILPALMLTWKQETFNSGDSYFEGMIDGLIVLPTKIGGNFNHLRRVGSIFQRFMGGRMNLFSKVPGLVKFGYGTTFNYDGLIRMDGLTAPVIQITIPFKFDLQLVRLQSPFDPQAPLDQSDIGFVERYILDIKNSDTGDLLEEVTVVTGQTN